jgi:DNA modification methylase
MTTTVTFHVGDVRDVMAAMPDNSVDLLVTSPPFLALRSYLPADHPDKHREIGSEPTPAAFLDTLLGLTADWRRVVAPWGSIAVEIGDTYSGSSQGGGDLIEGSGGIQHAKKLGGVDALTNGARQSGPGWPLAKSLCGIPTLYTWSLAYGRNLLTGQPSPAGKWRVRNLLTWTRPNPPVGALGDKYRPATSYVTVATVDQKRWFDLDAVRTALVKPDAYYVRRDETYASTSNKTTMAPYDASQSAGAPPLDWWDGNDSPDWQPLHRLPTQPYKGSHYAAFPVALPRRLIESMCPLQVCTVCGEGRRRVGREYVADNSGGTASGRRDATEPDSNTRGIHCKRMAVVVSDVWTDCGHDNYRPGRVLDPFGGSGTTALAAALCGRDAVLIDIDHRNVDLARQRLGEAVSILDERIDGDTIVWTVEPATTTELAAAKAGQLSIFDEEATA